MNKPKLRRPAVVATSAVLATSGIVATSLIVPTALATQEDVDRLAGEVNALTEEHAALSEQYNATVEQLAIEEELCSVAEDQATQQERRVADMEDQLGDTVVQAYKDGMLDPDLLLVTSDPIGYLENLGTLERLYETQGTTLGEYQEGLATLVQTRDEATQRCDELQATAAQLETDRNDIDRRLADTESDLTATQQALDAREEAARAASRDRGGAGGAAAPVPSGGAPVGTSCASLNIQAPNPRAAAAIEFACAQIGDAYRFGAAGPDAWDCSGLTSAAYGAAGVSLPHSSRLQSGYGTPVSRSELLPGDLVFFYSPISHVGIYVGDGLMVNALNSRTPVELTPLSYLSYSTARRL